MGQKKIEAYIDCVSPYSFYAFVYLQRNKQALQSLGVEVEFIPVFLGGINVGTGNKPPWTLPAKAAYAPYDTRRAQKYFGVKFDVPEFFPILSLLPQRCLTFVKKEYPEKFEALYEAFLQTLWLESKDISKPEQLRIAALKVFNEEQVDVIMKAAGNPEVKKMLEEATQHAMKDLGAFGCPWFWVHDGNGNEEPFFGSDRFHFMWEYLGLPHRDLELQTPKPTGKL
ncbi:uncharacterized protein E0L32_010981 [Thyridium curvatum]|uniref:Glutathione S-transferase kappa n=1 Tax=Thyridium curvatum TaxID=1093900 RepID=A0A507AL11_9PEZI|nr:uncharacterized protein E0L32_010981 [Thyridium curvatum]TPX07086.1 hypothetical protein E0L32_010981 [Thyridium curvatum]